MRSLIATFLLVQSLMIAFVSASQDSNNVSIYSNDFGNSEIGQYLKTNWMLPPYFLQEVIKAGLTHKGRRVVNRQIVESYGLDCKIPPESKCTYLGSELYFIQGTANKADGKHKVVIEVTIDLSKGVDSLEVTKTDTIIGDGA